MARPPHETARGRSWSWPRRRGCRHCRGFTVAVAYDGVPETIHDELGISECMHTDDGAVIAGEPHGAAYCFPPTTTRATPRPPTSRHCADMALPQPVTVKHGAGLQRRAKTLRRSGHGRLRSRPTSPAPKARSCPPRPRTMYDADVLARSINQETDL